MLFNFRQILFPAKGAGLKICLVFVRKQLWERSECTLIVGPAVWGRGPYKVKSVKHIFFCSSSIREGSSEEPGEAGLPCLVIPTAERVLAGGCRDGAAAWDFLPHSFRARIEMKKWKPRVGWDTAQGHLASLRGKLGRTRLWVFRPAAL